MAKIDVDVTTFANPFSFFCKPTHLNDVLSVFIEPGTPSLGINDVVDGQYVAVLYEEKWTRGVVNIKSWFLIWLLDHGKYFVGDNCTFVHLPSKYKRIPSKVFEASLHGITPVERIMTANLEIDTKVANIWNIAAVDKARSLIKRAEKIFFTPMAVLATKQNEIVLGNLTIWIRDGNIINLLEELRAAPKFLILDNETYITNMKMQYTSRRVHPDSMIKPLANERLPVMNLMTSLSTYTMMYTRHRYMTTLANHQDIRRQQALMLRRGAPETPSTSQVALPITPGEGTHLSITIESNNKSILTILEKKINELNIVNDIQFKNIHIKYFRCNCQFGNHGAGRPDWAGEDERLQQAREAERLEQAREAERLEQAREAEDPQRAREAFEDDDTDESEETDGASGSMDSVD